MIKNTYLEVLNDFFDQTYIVTEYTDNKNNLSFRVIKIIGETPVKDGVIITYITDKKQISLLDNRITHAQITGYCYNTINTSASGYCNTINLGLNASASGCCSYAVGCNNYKIMDDNDLDVLCEIAKYIESHSA